jgi:hypothetical protein
MRKIGNLSAMIRRGIMLQWPCPLKYIKVDLSLQHIAQTLEDKYVKHLDADDQIH